MPRYTHTAGPRRIERGFTYEAQTIERSLYHNRASFDSLCDQTVQHILSPGEAAAIIARSTCMCIGHMNPADEEGMRSSSSECSPTGVRTCHTSLHQDDHITVDSETSVVLHSQTLYDLLSIHRSRFSTSRAPSLTHSQCLVSPVRLTNASSA